MPFIKEGLAIIHCDPHVDGKPWPYAPRVILKNTLARLAGKGMQAKVGAEVEYFLVNKNPDGSLSTADARDDSPRPCYDARGVTRMYEHLTSISEAMNGLGWGNYANDHEDAAGQFEQNFNYADALTTADRVITLRYILNILAEQRGMTATFMPKPFTDRTGTGLHFHLSLWSGADALFPGTTMARTTAAGDLGFRTSPTRSSGASWTMRRPFRRSSPRRSTPTSARAPPPAPPEPPGHRARPRSAAMTAPT